MVSPVIHSSRVTTVPGVLQQFYIGAVIVFLLAPIVIGAVVAFNSGNRLEFPIPGFSLRWFTTALNNPQFITGLANSMIVGVGSALLAAIAGTAGAIALNHYQFRGRSLVQAALMLPIVIPGILLGLGLLFSLSAYRLRPGLVAAILGHAVIGLPYVVAMVSASLVNYDRSLERASMNLGVGPIRTFARITLPQIRGGVFAGAITAFLISFDNFSLSLFITRGDTLPLRLMQQLRGYVDPSVAAMSALLVLMSLLLLAVLLPLSNPRRQARSLTRSAKYALKKPREAQ